MRLLLILLAVQAAPAEYLDLRIMFQGTDCVSCAESLEGRLARVRGVQKVELDLQASSVHLELAEGNKVRLGPLRARITQDGTKIISIEAVCRGEIQSDAGKLSLKPTGLTQALAVVSDHSPEPGSTGIATGLIEGDNFVIEDWRPNPAGQ